MTFDQAKQALKQLSDALDLTRRLGQDEVTEACDRFLREVLDILEPSSLRTAAELELLLLRVKRGQLSNQEYTQRELEFLTFNATTHLANLHIFTLSAVPVPEESLS